LFETYTHSNRVEAHVTVAALPPELVAVVYKLVACGRGGIENPKHSTDIESPPPSPHPPPPPASGTSA
jgi:hypothetical protein